MQSSSDNEAPLISAARAEHRAFLYGLFGHNEGRRRYLLWEWLKAYQPVAAKGHLRDIFRDILTALLWNRAAFVVESTCFTILGDAFPVRYEWLDAHERRYIQQGVFRNRRQLFRNVKVLPNNVVHLSDFVLDGGVHPVWRRAMVRDLASWVQGPLELEFGCAVQRLALERGDPFLSEMYAALHGHGPVSMLACWGHGPLDPVQEPREEESAQLNAAHY